MAGAFVFANPNARDDQHTYARRPQSLPYDLNDPDVFEERSRMHSEELARRLKWAIDQGLHPANEHVHKAPGDDSQFMVSRAMLYDLT